MSRLLCLVATFISLSAFAQAPQLRWFKGNTHTHTLNSDGDSTPDEVVRWYREHGYHFLVLSDHNYLTPVDGLNSVHGAQGKFLVIPGEEVSDRFGDKPIHINALNLQRYVEPQGGSSVASTVQRNVDAIRAAEAVPHINHPNFVWAISPEDLKQVRNNRLLEIFNGHPLVNNLGGGDRPGMEEVWDILLSSGQLIYGIAVDDAHHFKRPWDRNASHPGRGWVVVRASELTAAAMMTALERGEFYASTGVEIDDYVLTAESMTVSMRKSPDVRYTTQFIGQGGKILEKTASNPAVYRFRGDETYVRAKVTDSNGGTAWMQPAFVSAKRSAK